MPVEIFNFRFKGSGVRKQKTDVRGQKTENRKVGQPSAAAKSQWTATRIKNL
jgi:hypothetical protein